MIFAPKNNANVPAKPTKANVTNATYNVNTTCFDVIYDTGEAITGTLFQTSSDQGGLTGEIKLNISETCSVAGRGTITLNVGEGTSSILLSEGALKYSVYEYLDEQPVSTGTITKTGDINIYTGFVLPKKYAKSYYIYVWLDGTIADNEYANVSFDGSIKASAMQTEDCVITYFSTVDKQLDVWTNTITRGQSFTLPSYDEKGFLTYYLDGDDSLTCYEFSEAVNFSCKQRIKPL